MSLETKEIPLFKQGALFPNDYHRDRINRYKVNEYLFKGDHFRAFTENPYLSKTQRNTLQMSINLPSIICKKSADFLFGESMRVLSGRGDDTPEQKAFDRITHLNNFNILTYESALSNSYYGDAFIKVRYGQEYNGMLPKEIDTPRVFIENLDPKNVYPEYFPYDKSKIKGIHIAVPMYDEDLGAYVLNVESHYPNLILYTKYYVTPMVYNAEGLIVQYKLDGEVEGSREYIKTGIPTPLVVHIPNTGIVGQWEGVDDLTEHHAIFDEINNRLSQISEILDKHSDPSMVVPTGLLDVDDEGNASFNISHNKVFEILGREDVIPQYITWDGQLANAFTELDKLVELLLTTAEIPTVVLGKGDSGTSGSSGLAIKWRMNSLLAKINRKRQYYQKGIQTILYITQLLESNLGIAEYKITTPVLQFNDGLPKDEMEQANIMSIRSGGVKTISQKSAIMILNNMTEEQAEKEIERIQQEQEKEMSLIDTIPDGSTGSISFTDMEDYEIA